MAERISQTSGRSYEAEPSGPPYDRFDTEVDKEMAQKSVVQYRPYTSFSATVTAAALAITTITAGVQPTLTKPAWAVSGDSSSGQSITEEYDDRNARLSAAIIAYRNLDDGWDGEGGKAPLDTAISEALAFIDLLPLGVRIPKTTVAGDGEVGFYWKTDDSFIDVSFYGDGNIYYYARIDSEEIEFDKEEPFSGRAISKKLISAISKI